MVAMRVEPFPPGARASDVMIVRPKTLPADASVAEVRDCFADDHVHLALLVDGGRLAGTVRRGDLPVDAEGAALRHATLTGRTVRPDDDMVPIHMQLLTGNERRLAVVAADGRLVGLLCLKRDRSGYCTDEGVAARAAERLSDIARSSSSRTGSPRWPR